MRELGAAAILGVFGVKYLRWQSRRRAHELEARRQRKQAFAAKEPLAARKKDFLRRLVKKTRDEHAAKVDQNYIAPFSPAPDKMVEIVLAELKPTTSDVVYDLGCGDARWLITAAKNFGCSCVGIELDADIVARAKKNVADEKVEDLVSIEQGDIYAAKFADATVVVVYAFAKAVERMKAMLTSQLVPGTRVVSVGFQFRGWKASWTKRVGHLPVYIYMLPE